MFKCLALLSALLVTVHCTGELSILAHPQSTVFKGHDHIKASLLKELYSSSLGFTTEQESNWQGMYLLNPFKLAKAVVTVSVDGVADIGPGKGHHFPLKTDEDEMEIYKAMEKRVEDRYPNSGDGLLRVELKNGLQELENVDIFKGIKDVKPDKTVGGALKLSTDEDYQFLEELAMLNAIVDKVSVASIKKDHTPHIYWFSFSTLHAVSDYHGENSTATKEAKQLLNDAIERLNTAFKKLYDGRVLVNVITSDASHTRRVRRAVENEMTEKAVDFDKLNLAKNYGSDYPVIFNIILWFGVVMIFTLLAICIFIGDMDPGRDSIIYRMTSTRMKKDN